MPRFPRVHADNAIYHTIARGNNKQDVFLSEDDYYLYLSLLEKYGNRHGVTLHAYALLPNHIHLLVQVGTRPLSGMMHVLQQSYTQAFNRRYGHVGHAFQGRYKALLVEDDAYLLQLVKYIHLNPVEAGLCREPDDYPWSSHSQYSIGWGRGKVETGLVKSVMAAFGTGVIDDYELLPVKPLQADLPDQPAKGATTKSVETILDRLLSIVAQLSDLPPSALLESTKSRHVVQAHRLFIFCASRVGYKMSEIGQYLGKSNTSVSEAVEHVTRKLLDGRSNWTHWVKQVLDEADSSTTVSHSRLSKS